MDVRRYEVFLRAVENGNLTRTAEELGYTQPGISQLIKKLEEECGFPLLYRGKGGVAATPDAKLMIPIMRELVKWSEQFRQTTSLIRGVETGTVRVASYSSIACRWLPGIISRFHREHPDIDIEVTEGVYNEIDEMICEKRVDMGLFSADPAQSYDAIPLGEDRMMVKLPTDHPLRDAKAFPLAALRDEAIIACMDIDNERVLAECRARYGPFTKKFIQSREMYAAVAMVANGLGVSMAGELFMKGFHENVISMPLEPNFSRTLIIGVPSLKEVSPAAKKFISYVRKYVAESRLG